MSFEQGGITFYEPADLSVVSWNDAVYMRAENRATNQAYHIKLEDISAKFAQKTHIEHYNDIIRASTGGILKIRNYSNSGTVQIFDDGKIWITVGGGTGYIRLSSSGRLDISAPLGVWINGEQLTVP